MEISPTERDTILDYVTFQWRFTQTIDHVCKMTQMHSHPRITHDFHRSCKAYILENMSSVYWYRPWYATRLCFGSASGLLRLEELVRRFLISRETLSIRMLDDNLDPTPLLKEIRDDKVATIIIDANASVSYLILKKVRSRTSIRPSEPPTSAGCEVTWVWSTHSSTLGFELFSLTFPFGKESGYSREGRAELTICRIIKQLSQSPTGCTFVVLTELTCIFFTFSALWSCTGNNIYSFLPATMTYTLKKVSDKRTFCWNAVQMLHRLVLIHGTACNADSQRSESQFECVCDVFAGHIGAAVRPQRNVLVLVWWCKTVINVCSLSLLLSTPIFSLTLSPNCLLYSLPLNNPPPLPFLSLPPSIFPHLPLFHILYPTCLFFIFPSRSLFLFVLQASELGMTSAFYKYILTTMVRAHQCYPILSSAFCGSAFTRSSLPLCPFISVQRC